MSILFMGYTSDLSHVHSPINNYCELFRKHAIHIRTILVVLTNVAVCVFLLCVDKNGYRTVYATLKMLITLIL